jgi:hypothetical protein
MTARCLALFLLVAAVPMSQSIRTRLKAEDSLVESWIPGQGLLRAGTNIAKLGLLGAGADAMLSHPRPGDGSYPGARVVTFAKEPGCGTRLWIATNSYVESKNPANNLDSLAPTLGIMSWFRGKSTPQVANEAGDQFENLVHQEQERLSGLKEYFFGLKEANPVLTPLINPLVEPINHALAPIPEQELQTRKNLIISAVTDGIKDKSDKSVAGKDINEVVRLSAAELVYSKAFASACPANLDKNLHTLLKDTVVNGAGHKEIE